MGISKTEINLRRLLAAASHQQNQAKLIHYVATLREQLEQLAEERTSDGLLRVSKAQVNDYSEKIEGLAAKLATPVSQFCQKLCSLFLLLLSKKALPKQKEKVLFPLLQD
ncbi:unnamed protein product [Camellia sinensis]